MSKRQSRRPGGAARNPRQRTFVEAVARKRVHGWRPAVLACLAILALVPAAASARLVQHYRTVTAPLPAPLTGNGENMEIVANVEIPGTTEVELAGDFAYVAGNEGLVIVDISNPRDPKRHATLECAGSWGDVELNPQATLAVLAADGTGTCAGPGLSGSLVVDITDKANPKQLAFIDVKGERGEEVGSHTHTLDGHILYINNYDPDYRKIELYDLTDPASPKKLSQIAMDGTGAHDSYPDHRPDGKVLLYSASVATHDVIDVTDPRNPRRLQKVQDPEVGISHQAEPNFKRELIVVSDEYGGGAAGPGCGKSPTADAANPVPVAGAPQDLGAVHFYKAAADGTFNLAGADKAGTFNIPTRATPDASSCTAHVYWQAPDQNRFTIAWYTQGSRVVDFSDPARSKQLGWFIPTGARTWSAKPHRGYIFSSDLNRGLDVLRYIGEGGAAWPATAGPAEIQRTQRQGNYKPPAGGGQPSPPGTTPPGGSTPGAGQRSLGPVSFSARIRVRGKRGKRVKLSFTATDTRGRSVAKVRFKARAGKRTRVRGSGVAVAGTYKYVIRVGKRIAKRGRIVVKPSARPLKLAANQTFSVRIR